MTSLTARQRVFVNEYITDFNATRAAESAGYSPHSSRQIGAENLTKPYIRKEIDEALKRRSAELGSSVEKRIRELRFLLNADIADCFDRNGSIKPMSEIPEEFRTLLIESLKVREVRSPNGETIGRSFSIRFVDRTALLKELGQLLGAWG